MKRLLLLAHAPSPNTLALREAVFRGAVEADTDDLEVTVRAPLEAGPDDVRPVDGILLGTTENLGYMSGALKDFFDRSYYPLLEEKQGLPCAVYIRAGQDGTGTRRALDSILTGLKWRQVAEPLVLRGAWDDAFLQQAEALGLTMAAGLDAGVF